MYLKLPTALGLLLINFYSFAQYTFNEIEIWSGNFSSAPKYFEEMNGELYFQAYNTYNYELWKTNGTSAGTSIVADINGGASSAPESLKAFNGELFFTATSSGFGKELWKTDGTSAGTQMLKDVRPGSSNGFPTTTIVTNGERETFMEFSNELFFFGNTGNGTDLWKTDGTTNGTVSLKNFTQGNIYGHGTYSSRAGEHEKLGVVFNNELYFFVVKSYPIPSQYRGELWKTDGTSVGTVLVKDSLASTVRELIVANNKIYFSNSTMTNGAELWSSDGTNSGTGIEVDINPGGQGSYPRFLTLFNGDLFYSAVGLEGRELYRTDDTSTVLLKDIYPGMGTFTPNSSLALARFKEYNGMLYFIADDGSTGSNELWRTDGTNLGTIKALTLSQTGGYIEFLTPQIVNGEMFYKTSSQLWVTDGTPSGTSQLSDNGNSSEPISQINHLSIFQQNLWFAGANATNGSEAWYLGAQPPSSINITACESYTVPSGNETYVSSGSYYDTLTNTQGNDSILLINLTVNQTTTSTIDVETCGTYLSPSGNQTLTSTGTYLDTLTNLQGCDSVITINLTLNTSTSTINETVCNNYVSPSGNYTWMVSDTYTDTIQNSNGCDSIITINLTVIPDLTSMIQDTICNDGSVIVNGTIYDALTPTGTEIISNVGTFGCDSIITIDLTILPVIDNTISIIAPALLSNQSGASYQWLDCDNGNAPIPSETNQSFAPTAITGNYAVVVTMNGCSDTSDCVLMDFSGIEELTNSDKELIMIIDLTGRETTFVPNTPLIFIYSDGTRERVMDIKH